MGQVVLLAFAAAFNPTLLAAVTVMLVLDNPKRLLLGYLLGAMLTSISIGLVVVFTLDGSSQATDTARHTINPALDIVLGVLVLVLVFVVGTGRDKRRRARSARRKAERAGKPPPKWKQALSGGSMRTTFVVGALLTLPGASYLAGLARIVQEDLPAPGAVAAVVGFNAIMLLLLEGPLLGYAVAPERTATAVHRFSAWLSRDGGRILLVVVALLGLALVTRGIVSLAG